MFHAIFFEETRIIIVQQNNQEKDEENIENLPESHTIFDTQIINKDNLHLEVLTEADPHKDLI